jgi:hypothetical protein
MAAIPRRDDRTRRSGRAMLARGPVLDCLLAGQAEAGDVAFRKATLAGSWLIVSARLAARAGPDHPLSVPGARRWRGTCADRSRPDHGPMWMNGAHSRAGQPAERSCPSAACKARALSLAAGWPSSWRARPS